MMSTDKTQDTVSWENWGKPNTWGKPFVQLNRTKCGGEDACVLCAWIQVHNKVSYYFPSFVILILVFHLPLCFPLRSLNRFVLKFGFGI